jgi:hypothetical protein
MTKYLTSSDQVPLLCKKFGYALENLSISELQLLRAILANSMTIESACKPFCLTESMLETENMIARVTNKYPSVSDAVFVAVGIWEGIDIDTAEELIECITKLIKSKALAPNLYCQIPPKDVLVFCGV